MPDPGSLRAVHRYVGLSAAAFVCILALTGLVLNRSTALELNKHYVAWPPLLDWYGIKAPTSITSFSAGKHHLVSVGHQLFLDSQRLPGEYASLQGASRQGDLLLVAAAGELLLFTQTGDLVERVSGAPPQVTRLGHHPDGSLLVESPRGVFGPDADFVRWQPHAGSTAEIAWILPSRPPAPLLAQLTNAYRGRILSWERVLLDLHSGRILGRYGEWLMDAAAIAMLALALTGTWLWARRP